MRPHPILTALPHLIVAAVGAAAIKLYYSSAGVNELTWVLAPTTFLVELVTGSNFRFEAGVGYMSGDHTFLIAASCSGVNFLITAFLMMSFAWVLRSRTRPAFYFVPISLCTAYLVTLIANTVRISTAMQIRHLDPASIGLTADQIHRFEGIVVYFSFLVLLYSVGEKLTSGDKQECPPSGPLPWLFPLGTYYATTLGIPLVTSFLRGGPAKEGVWEHGVFVILVPAGLLALLTAVRSIRSSRVDSSVPFIDTSRTLSCPFADQ